MPKLVYITRKIPELGLRLLQEKGIEIDVSPKDRPLTKRELIRALQKKSYDGVLSLLTDTIDTDIFDAAPSIKIVANYAVGFNNIDVAEAKKRGITVTNTPGALTEAVAEHTIALMLSLVRRVVESDVYLRTGKFKGWGPELFLGDELMGRTLGILGAGRIGGRVSDIAKKGLGMSVPETRHFITQARLALMKKTAYLINTSRGPVIDEDALAGALRAGVIRGAALDVFEYEPKLAKGLAKLSNVVLTPHIASATTEARLDMARMAAENIIAALEGKTPPNLVS
ncbi:MAG: hypothetical protein UY03_C0011G0011 [Parcubacteria group bacterium GW2011_GWA2_47_64]|nr:MAG: hypothetical protein UY03_C0011G0011 [Parcubacteria group bacterium GW2011_GWA2_47_64]